MTLTVARKETGQTRGMQIKVFALSRSRAERKLRRIARYCYGDKFTEVDIARR
jgi:hypothetical protein